MKYDPSARFWAKVDRSGGPLSCWLWRAGTFRYGYGQFWTGTKKIGAHRFAYELAHGPINPEMVLCHSCDNPPCVNPEHLWLGSMGDNNADRDAKGRTRNGQGKTHCKYGHEFSDANTYRWTDGVRKCRICMRRRSLEDYRRNRTERNEQQRARIGKTKVLQEKQEGERKTLMRKVAL